VTEQQAMFEAVCLTFGWSPDQMTKTERTKIGRVCSELRAANWTPEMVRFAPAAWDRMWPGGDPPTLTPTAIVAHSAEIARRFRGRARAREARAAAEVTPGPPPLPLAENRARMRQMLRELGTPFAGLLRDLEERP
jgi:hypothetical protein